jgi:hypothetical protein
MLKTIGATHCFGPSYSLSSELGSIVVQNSFNIGERKAAYIPLADILFNKDYKWIIKERSVS